MASIIQKTVAALKRNEFRAFAAKNGFEAKKLVLSLVPRGASAGIGGSVTIRRLGLVEALEERGNEVVHHWLPGVSGKKSIELRKKELAADVFLCSANAVTMDGKLVNAEGIGNRLAAMIFGPPRVIVVAGSNKVVKNVGAALKRIREVAVKKNAERLGRKPEDIMRIIQIIEKKPEYTDFCVVLVDEELGF